MISSRKQNIIYNLPLSFFNRNFNFISDYEEEGFLAIQRTVDKAITRLATLLGTLKLEDILPSLYVTLPSHPLDDIDVHLQRYPYPPYVEDVFILVSQYQLPFIIILSFLVVAPNLAKDVVLEKERKLKVCLLKNY